MQCLLCIMYTNTLFFGNSLGSLPALFKQPFYVQTVNVGFQRILASKIIIILYSYVYCWWLVIILDGKCCIQACLNAPTI